MSIRTVFARGSRWWPLAVVSLSLTGIGVLTFTLAFGIAQASGASGAQVRHYGPFASTSPDSGTCGVDWANDTFKRSFTIQLSTPNTVLERADDGTFVALAGPSPNACVILPGPTGNGNTVRAGVKGEFSGSFDIAVSGGTFDPEAKCTPTTCDTTAGFIHTIYGKNATYVTGITFFEFNYYTHENGAWHDASANRDGDNGDITGTAEPRKSDAERREAGILQS